MAKFLTAWMQVACVFGANLQIVVSSIMGRRNGLMALSVMRVPLSRGEVQHPEPPRGRSHRVTPMRLPLVAPNLSRERLSPPTRADI